MVLEGQEKSAREERKGLWIDPQPVPLWVVAEARGQRRGEQSISSAKNPHPIWRTGGVEWSHAYFHEFVAGC